MELRTVTGCQPTDPEEVAFPSARQIVALNRRVLRGDKKMSNETVHLITSLEPEKASGEAIKKMKRDYWKIESALHYRLDTVLDEDRSRVRHPKAALVLGMFRRLALSFAMPWIANKRIKNKRTSTRDFLEHLEAHNARRAFDLTTSKSPTSWKN